MIKLYNTLSRKKEELPEPSIQKKIRLFVCGPTVYDYLHIGNARTYIFFDFFAKYLRSQGYEVDYLQNITDIDDKIIKRAAEENKKPEEAAKFFTDAYFEDMNKLGVDAVNHYASATDFITQIVAQVERLIEKEFAYKIEGDGWYFDIAKDKDYGKLSGRTAEQAEDSISRIDESVGKRNKGDFCLWKFSKEGEPSWPARIGAGRPGWHIEDTAITENRFGPQYDIHGGGVDLKFPHHEAEIAQQESASGLKPFVKIWMHTGTLLVDGKKMSKSLGNFITIRDFLKKYTPEVLRLMVLGHHYRSPMDYGDEAARSAKATIESLKGVLGRLSFLIEKESGITKTLAEADHFSTIDNEFSDALSDDLNTPEAIAAVFEIISDFNLKMSKGELWKLGAGAAIQARSHIEKTLAVLGFSFELPQIPSKISELAAEREKSRGNKQFEHSDALRQEINALGYEVEDTPRGPFLWPR